MKGLQPRASATVARAKRLHSKFHFLHPKSSIPNILIQLHSPPSPSAVGAPQASPARKRWENKRRAARTACAGSPEQAFSLRAHRTQPPPSPENPYTNRDLLFSFPPCYRHRWIMKNNKNSRESEAPRNPAYPRATLHPRISLTTHNIPPTMASIHACNTRFATPHAEKKPLPPHFLIAIPLLEFPLTHTKQNHLTFSNREYIAVFQFFSLITNFLPVAS